MPEREPQHVLLVDDSQDIHDIVAARLRAEHVVLHHVYDRDEAVAALEEQRPDLILLDIDLPGTDGLTLCRELKCEREYGAIPIIFLTGTMDTPVKVQAFELGAVDYVTKPFDSIELRARVHAALRTKRYHDLLATRAQIDALTGLHNRSYFEERFAEELAAAHRHGHYLSILMVDIDYFKRINDTHGHPFGDTVLRAVSDAFYDILRASDVVCRYGGEEFVIMLRETSAERAAEVAERLRKRFASLGLSRGGEEVPISASFGIAGTCLMENAEQIAGQELVHRADRALYAAKRAGRNRVEVAAEPG